MSWTVRSRLLAPVALAWLVITGITVVPYVVVYFWMDAPEWAPPLFTPLFFLYWPAWALAYAVGNSDFPLYEFGAFVLLENVPLAIGVVALLRGLNGRRGEARLKRSMKESLE